MSLQGLGILRSRDQRGVRHCKIVATLGPASSSEEVIRQLIESGLDVARLNFSHGTHADHLRNIETIRRLSRELDRNVMILQDLQGPKIRCGQLLGGSLNIEADTEYALVFGVEQTDPRVIPIDYRDLVRDVKEHQRVLMDDGLLSFQITRVASDAVHVVAADNGVLKPRKGVNFPDSKLSMPALTEKDSRDVLFGVTNHVDFIALSFVQEAKDILQLKKMVSALGSDVPIIAKIERLNAIKEIEAIAEAADGLMVARGDLGVEGSIEKVPIFQRRIIDVAAAKSRPVIIATQMLESMVANPRATLAEVADVANGVLDGADCLMLSAEVASGKYPVQCVQKMDAVIRQVEAWTFRRTRYTGTGATGAADPVNSEEPWPTHEAIARAACEAADSLGAKAIVCLSLTGSIAKSIARWRPATPIIAISPRQDVVQRLTMVWGVYAVQNQLFYNTDTLLQDMPVTLQKLGVVNPGDVIVVTAGIPLSQMNPTNMIKINRI